MREGFFLCYLSNNTSEKKTRREGCVFPPPSLFSMRVKQKKRKNQSSYVGLERSSSIVIKDKPIGSKKKKEEEKRNRS